MEKYGRNRYLTDIVIYTSLGCLSYILLVHYTDILSVRHDRMLNLKAFMAVTVLFNGVGLSVRYMTGTMMKYYLSFITDRKMLVLAFTVAAVCLLASNYLSVAIAKLMAGIHHPFEIRDEKVLYVMACLWLVQLLTVGMHVMNSFYKDVVRLYRREKELEESNAEARYMALQNQMNPHFLFNCLNTLVSEIEYDSRSAAEFTRNLADTYRYILHCQNMRTVPLSEEMEFAETYLQLHKVRTGDCLETENLTTDEHSDIPVPPLTLQILLENVIKHNVMTQEKPMHVTLSFEKDESGAWLVMKNDLRPKKGAVSTGKGLENLSQRCRILCGRSIIAERTEYSFTVKIPVEDE